MAFKEKLQQISQTFLSLKTKIVKLQDNFTKQLASKDSALTKKTNQFNETARKLELSAKESKENENILDQLLKEMRELEGSL